MTNYMKSEYTSPPPPPIHRAQFTFKGKTQLCYFEDYTEAAEWCWLRIELNDSIERGAKAHIVRGNLILWEFPKKYRDHRDRNQNVLAQVKFIVR